MDFILILSASSLVLTAALLIAIVMFQGPQDDSSGGVAAQRMHHVKMLGAAQAPNLLEKFTSILATLFISLVLVTSYVIKQRYDAQHRTSETIEQVRTYMISDQKKRKVESLLSTFHRSLHHTISVDFTIV